jgi:hypothetical protein
MPLQVASGGGSFGFTRRHRYAAVIVAVRSVGVVEMPVHQVVDVIAVRDCFMAALGAMSVRLFVSGAVVLGRTTLRILRGHFDPVILDLASVGMVQMAIVQIVHVAVMKQRGVAAVLFVFVRMRA